MIPKIISSIPQNGAENISADSEIQITFSTAISWDLVRNTNFVLRNITKNTIIPLVGSPLIDRGLLTITLTPIQVDGHFYEAGCEYSVTILGLYDSSGIYVDESYTIFFTSEAAIPDSINYDGDDDVDNVYVDDSDLNILFTYPRYNSVNITPELIRIRFDKVLNKEVMDFVQGTEDCVFVLKTEELDADTADYLTIDGDLDIVDTRPTDITFKPNSGELIANTRYTIYIKNVIDIWGDTFGPYNYSFRVKGANTWITISDLKVVAPAIIPFISEITEEDLYQKIELIGMLFTDYCSTNSISYLGSSTGTPTIYFLEYIKAYTVYDIIFNKITSLNLSAQSKVLGDFEVSYRSNLSDLLKLLDHWQKRMSVALEKLKGNASGVKIGAGFIKGSNIDTAYAFMSRAMQVEDSTEKSW